MGTEASWGPRARSGHLQTPASSRVHAAPPPSGAAWFAPTFAPRCAPWFAPRFAPWFAYRSQRGTGPVATTPAYRSYERSQPEPTCSRGLVGSGFVLLWWMERGGAVPGGVSMDRALVR
jgi:hypothetical protein